MGSASCAPCIQLKQWLASKGIRYEYVERGDATIFPTLIVDGRRVEGLNWREIMPLLRPLLSTT